MIEIAVTFVAAADRTLDAAFEKRATTVIRALGVDIKRLDWLFPARALDIIVAGEGPLLLDALRRALADMPGHDIFVQPNDATRRKKLMVSDMDATIIEDETLDALAAKLGIHDKIAPITERAMRGELDFQQALEMRIGLLKSVPVARFFEMAAEVKISRGATPLVKTLKRHGVRTVLVSGGFDIVTQAVADRLGFDKNVGNSLIVDNNGLLTGDVAKPIVGKERKKQTLLDECRVLAIDPALSLAIGDGANDIPMLQAAGAGIGHFGKPAVQAAVPYQIRYTDLTSVLFMQGYRREEIVL